MTQKSGYSAGVRCSFLAMLALFGAAACAGARPRAVELNTVHLSWERRSASSCPPETCADGGVLVDLVAVGATRARIRAAETTGSCDVVLPPSNSGDLVSELRCRGPHDDDRVTVQVVRRAAGELVVVELRTEVADGPQPTRQQELGHIAIAPDARVIATGASRNDRWR